MRTWFATLVVSIASSTSAFAEAENYDHVRVDAGMTGSFVAVGDRNGAGFVTEIKANVHDQLAIGGRVEIAMMFGGHADPDTRLDFAMAACGLLKGEYFPVDGIVRPFFGAGIGAYTIGSQSVRNSDDSTVIEEATGRYFGVAPQVGIDVGPVRFAATYNAILGATLEVRRTIGGTTMTEELSQNYLSLELSFRFSGGRKQPAPVVYTAAP